MAMRNQHRSFNTVKEALIVADSMRVHEFLKVRGVTDKEMKKDLIKKFGAIVGTKSIYANICSSKINWCLFKKFISEQVDYAAKGVTNG